MTIIDYLLYSTKYTKYIQNVLTILDLVNILKYTESSPPLPAVERKSTFCHMIVEIPFPRAGS